MIPESDVALTDMQKTANGFAFLAFMLSLNGRRLQRAYEQSRYRMYTATPDSPMLRAPMAPRRDRRRLQGESFRPVYGYIGPGKAD